MEAIAYGLLIIFLFLSLLIQIKIAKTMFKTK